MMLSKAWDYIQLNKMIEKGDRIVVGVSGGADSVCLLYVLEQFCKKAGAYLIAVHVNHCLRGEEADRDEDFVRNLCSDLNIECYVFSYDVKEIAASFGLSEEEAGRKVRYEAFSEICQMKKCNKIAIAHNRNDNAETVLFHLFRGSGIKGLSGIAPLRKMKTASREITIIRPLLETERSDIEEYLKKEGIPWITDSSNLTEDYTRNKIRNRVIDYAAGEINNKAVKNIAEAASHLRETGDYIQEEIRKGFENVVTKEMEGYLIPVALLQKEHRVIQKGIILLVLENLAGGLKDLEGKHVEAVLELMEKQVGRNLNLPYRIMVEREYENLRLFCGTMRVLGKGRQATFPPVPVTIPGKTYLPQGRKIFETELINYKNTLTIPKNSCVKWFDYDKIENAVEIRTRREGDYIQINSSGGNKKLKDYFIDQKIPRNQRDSQLLVTDGSHIMWIIGDGERMSERYKVDDSTVRVLLMKLYDLEENADDKQSKGYDF